MATFMICCELKRAEYILVCFKTTLKCLEFSHLFTIEKRTEFRLEWWTKCFLTHIKAREVGQIVICKNLLDNCS